MNEFFIITDINKAFGHKDINKLQKKEITNKRGYRQTVYVSYDKDNFKNSDKEGNTEITANYGSDNEEIGNILDTKHLFFDKHRKNKDLTKLFNEKLGGRVLRAEHEYDDNGNTRVHLTLKNGEDAYDVDELSEKLQDDNGDYNGIESQTEDGDMYHHDNDYDYAFDSLMKYTTGEVDVDDMDNIIKMKNTISKLKRTFSNDVVKQVLHHRLISEYNTDKEIQKNYKSAHDFVNDYADLFGNFISSWKIKLTNKEKILINLKNKEDRSKAKMSEEEKTHLMHQYVDKNDSNYNPSYTGKD